MKASIDSLSGPSDALPKVMIDRLGWEVMRQKSGTACTQNTEDGIDHRLINTLRSPTRFGWWNQALQQFPLLIGQIAEVGSAHRSRYLSTFAIDRLS